MQTQQRPIWSTTQFSSTGSRHLKRGEPCQDFAAMRISDGVLICAVADGVSAAPLGELGSKCVTKVAVSFLAKQKLRRQRTKELQANVARSLIEARRFLEKVAITKRVPLHNLATTCIVAVSTPLRTVVGQIGDGGSVASTANGELLALTIPAHSEMANYPDSITDQDFKRNLKFALHEAPVESLALFTDGLEALALEGFTVPHRPFFDPLFRWLKELEPAELQKRLSSFLQGERVCARTADDCTLAIARRQRSADV